MTILAWNLTISAVSLLAAAPSYTSAAPARSRSKVRLTSPISHGDWPGRYAAAGREVREAWEPEGVREILDRAKECGWTRVYWRAFGGGRACYNSCLLGPCRDLGDPEENYHLDHGGSVARLTEYYALDHPETFFTNFDPLREAIRYGREIGLEVHAWLSINEDDHGYGWASRFARENPHLTWVRRDGTPFRSQLSFAHPEVREYKLALMEEILQYEPDGIFFDWIRTGDVREDPHNDEAGVANYGYENPNLERFRELHGLEAHQVPNDDERWIAVRAEPLTQFMREASALIRSHNPDMVIAAMTQHPWGYRGTATFYAGSLPGLLVDIRTWAREGLVDEAVVAGYYVEGGDAEQAYRYLQEQTEGRIPLWLFGWLSTSPEPLVEAIELAERVGAAELLLWESDYIGLPPQNEEAVRAMREYAARATR